MRASRALRRGLLAALAVGVTAVGGVWLASERAFQRTYPVRDEALVVDPRPPDVERGRHLVTAVAQCTFCHGDDLAGRVVADDPWIGRIDSGNLTRGRGGVARDYTPTDWARALRDGVRPDGTSLLLMPARGFAELKDADVAAIVAYLETAPPVDRVPRSTRIGWLARIVVAAGLAPDIFSAEDVSTARRETSVAAAPPHADGAYLVEIGNCRVCHKADLRGGLHPLALPGEPPPPPLVGPDAMAGWQLDDFRRAMRQGRTRAGRQLDPAFMPWPRYAALTDTELEALWRYLRDPIPQVDVATR